MRLERAFFEQPTVEVAQQLIGATLIINGFEIELIETEAYVGEGDAACHAHRGITPRTKVMFGPPGRTYIYLIYGMYHCLNIVTEPEGSGSAVLIRGGLIKGPTAEIIKGPGRLCRHLGLTKAHNEMCLLNETHFVRPRQEAPPIKATPRIGITKATDKPWRFINVDYYSK